MSRRIDTTTPCPACGRPPSAIPPYPDGGRWHDLSGQPFGRLTALHRYPPTPGQPVKWCCACACGAHPVALAQNLVAGHTRSCGCYHRDVSRGRRVNTDPDTYRLWTSLRKRYRAALHPAWAASFPAFLAAVGRRPTRDALLRRLDPDGPYGPGNVRWVARTALPFHQKNATAARACRPAPP